MPSPRLEVNFFVVALPDKPLPFFVRELGEGETLRDPEYGWKIDVPQPVTQNKAILVRERRPQDVDYETEEHLPAIVAPGIVKRLLEFAEIRCQFIILTRKSGKSGKSGVSSSFLPERMNRHRAKKLGRGG